MSLGVRSYGSSLLMQNVYNPEALPDTVPALKSFASKILSPVFKCVEEDCKTTIGRTLAIPEIDSVGLIDLATNSKITDADVVNWITNGIFIARVRDTSTCLSEGGFCSKCGNGFFARKGENNFTGVGDEYVLQTSARSYQNYIAGKYAGSLMGFSTLTSDHLPAPQYKWSLLTSHKEMDKLCALLGNMKINSDELAYLYTIDNILERALAIIGTYGVYGNA